MGPPVGGVGDWQVAAPLDVPGSASGPGIIQETPLEVFTPSLKDLHSHPEEGGRRSEEITRVRDVPRNEQPPGTAPSMVQTRKNSEPSTSASTSSGSSEIQPDTQKQPQYGPSALGMLTPPGVVVDNYDEDIVAPWEGGQGGTVDVLTLDRDNEPLPLPTWDEEDDEDVQVSDYSALLPVDESPSTTSSGRNILRGDSGQLETEKDDGLKSRTSSVRRGSLFNKLQRNSKKSVEFSPTDEEWCASPSENPGENMNKSILKGKSQKLSSRGRIGFSDVNEVAEFDAKSAITSSITHSQSMMSVGGMEAELQPIVSSRMSNGDSFFGELGSKLTSQLSLNRRPSLQKHTQPEWFTKTPGVAHVLSLNPNSGEFREQWSQLRTAYSSRHQQENLHSDFQKETETLAKRLNQNIIPAIAPTKSPYLRYWDAFLMLLISCTTLLQPFETAFGLSQAFDYANYSMDAIFVFDLALQFNIAYVDQATVKLITRHDLIAKHYLKTAFAVDLIASLPYQLIMHFVPLDEYVHDIRRLLVLLPLLRLFRLSRAKRIFVRMEQLYSLDHGVLSIVTFIVQTVMLCHFCACLWGLVPLFQGHDAFGSFQHDHSSPHTSYAACLYLGVMTLTSVGYGDIWPITTYERWLAMLIMLSGAYFFGYVIGSITNTVSIRNHAQNYFYETMDKLQAFIEEHQVGKDLGTRLRSYFIYRYQSDAGAGVSWNELFDLMSPSLKQQVAKATCAKWINDVSYFSGCEEDFIIRLSLSLVPETYTPQEKLISLGEESSRMYVVRQGVVASEGRISISGGVIGIDMLTNLYISSGLIRNYEAIALTFSNVMRCDKDIVLDILDKFPNTSATLRRTVIRHVFQMEVRSYSRAVVRIITGRRSIHARLMGDPSGREEHYYQKLIELSPSKDPAAIRKSLDTRMLMLQKKKAEAAELLERRKSNPRVKSAKRNSNTSKALHRAHEDKEAQLEFNGGQYNVAEVPDVIMSAMQRLTLQVRELQLELEKQKQLSGPAAMRISELDSGIDSFEAPVYLKQRSSAHTGAVRAGIRFSLTQRPAGMPESLESLQHTGSFQSPVGAPARRLSLRRTSSALSTQVVKIRPSSAERSSRTSRKMDDIFE